MWVLERDLPDNIVIELLQNNICKVYTLQKKVYRKGKKEQIEKDYYRVDSNEWIKKKRKKNPVRFSLIMLFKI